MNHAKDSYVIWEAGRYRLWRRDRGVMGPQYEIVDDEYGDGVTPEELVELRDVLIKEFGPS